MDGLYRTVTAKITVCGVRIAVIMNSEDMCSLPATSKMGCSPLATSSPENVQPNQSLGEIDVHLAHGFKDAFESLQKAITFREHRTSQLASEYTPNHSDLYTQRGDFANRNRLACETRTRLAFRY